VETFRIDSLVMAALFPSRIIGYYAVALSVSNPPRFIADGIVAVGYVHVSAQDIQEGRASTRRYLLAAALLCGGAALVIALTLPWIIPLIFGQRFEPAVRVSAILVVTAALISIRRVGSDCLRGLGQPGAATVIELITLSALVPAFFLLARWGAGSGVAVSLGICAALGLALTLAFLRRHEIEKPVIGLSFTRSSSGFEGRRRRATERSSERGSWMVYIFGYVVALLLGLGSGHLAPVVVGVGTLLPVFSHVRHVGLRRAIAEPSAATIIVGFYLLVFPLRGLVIAARGYTDVLLVRGPVSGADLATELLLASLATTVLVEAYYLLVGRRPLQASVPRQDALVVRPPHAGVTRLAVIIGVLALAALFGVLVQYGGLSGAQAALLSHGKESMLQGPSSISISAWAILSAPAVWCAACVAVDTTRAGLARTIFVFEAVFIIVAQLVVFGSRLDAILALIGAWIVFHYSGRTIPAKRVLVAIPVLILLSLPIVSERPGGNNVRLPAIEQYSRIAGYGVLDASLAVRQDPAGIRRKLTNAQRWLDLPAYLVPAAIWPGRPNIQTRRLDLYVAQTLGTLNDQATGFPTTYVTEAWLLGGWPVVLLMSALFGALLGWLHRKLVTGLGGSPASLLSYCFIVTLAFSYYKDGDALVTFVGNSRAAVYLGLAMLATGVWRPQPISKRTSTPNCSDGSDRDRWRPRGKP